MKRAFHGSLVPPAEWSENTSFPPARLRGVPRVPLIVSVSLTAALAAVALAAPAPVRFSRDLLPLLKKECASCHTGSAAPGGYSLESAAKLLAGGRHGAAVVPGKSAEGTLVKYLTGEMKPQMPPGKPLALDTIALVRRWIDEGAAIDSMTVPSPRGKTSPSKPAGERPERLPLPAAVDQSAPVTALAFSPDGKTLAVGGFRAVRLLNPATGEGIRTLRGPTDQALALAWSADGGSLAAGGGLSGAFGELCIWDAATWSEPRVFRDHADTIYSLAWKPQSPEIATAGLDKTVRLWDVSAGKVSRTLKDHADVVFAVAYSPDGKWMATGSADRSVKLYSTGSYARPVSMIAHGDAVTALAFSPKGDLLVTAAADKQVRVWPVKAGPIDNPLRGHGEGDLINALAFSADGSVFVWGAANRNVRVWNGDVATYRQDTAEAADWVYAVAASPDGKTIAAGAGDGKIYLWNEANGKPLGERAVRVVDPAAQDAKERK